MKLKSIKKRNLLLLEVMIAFALITLCALPLIAPHIWMLKDDLRQISYLERQNLANTLFIETAENLYDNTIPFESIEEGFYKGDLTYGLIYMKSQKPKNGNTDDEKYYLIDFHVSFQNEEEKKATVFPYTFFIARKVPLGTESKTPQTPPSNDSKEPFEEEDNDEDNS